MYEHFWNDTYNKWSADGYIKDESLTDHFNFDIQEFWPFNMVADLDFVPQIISETEETVTMLDGNGATLRRHKHHDATPEHIDFNVKDSTA